MTEGLERGVFGESAAFLQKVFRLSIEVLLRFDLIASIALHPSAEIVVLALRANPPSIREVKLLLIPSILRIIETRLALVRSILDGERLLRTRRDGLRRFGGETSWVLGLTLLPVFGH